MTVEAKTAKPLSTSPQGIRGLLNKAGIMSGSSSSTRVRGFRSYTTGMTVEAADRYAAGFICKISYYAGRSAIAGTEGACLDKIARILTEAGYEIVRSGFSLNPDDTTGPYVWVRTPNTAS